MKNHLCFCVCHSASRQAVLPSPAGKKLKVFAFFRSRRHKIDAQLKNVLRFELHFSFCFGKAEGAEKLRLELLQVVFQEDVPPELLSFVLSFQKRKYIKNRCLRKAPFLMTPVHFALQPHPLLGEACKGASHLLQISLGEGCKFFPAREQYNTPARSAPFLFTLNSKKHPFGCLFHCSSFSIISAFLILPTENP